MPPSTHYSADQRAILDPVRHGYHNAVRAMFGEVDLDGRNRLRREYRLLVGALDVAPGFAKGVLTRTYDVLAVALAEQAGFTLAGLTEVYGDRS